jgi:hypothetical protein
VLDCSDIALLLQMDGEDDDVKKEALWCVVAFTLSARACCLLTPLLQVHRQRGMLQ